MTSRPTRGPGAEAPLGTRVLVVDDDSAVRLVLARALSAAGYQVRLAGSGAEALLEIALLAVDVVVSDVTMIPMSGLELALALRQRHLGLPILFVSSGMVPAEMLDDPLMAWVRKPAPLVAVLLGLETLMERASQGDGTTDLSVGAGPSVQHRLDAASPETPLAS